MNIAVREFVEGLLRQYDRLVATHQNSITGTLLVVQDYQMEKVRPELRKAESTEEVEIVLTPEQLKAENTRMRAAIAWANGEGPAPFEPPRGSSGFWWREELRRRAGLR